MTAQLDDSKDVLDNNKTVPWYREKPDQFSPAARELLERYSHIAPDKVDSHVQDVRERAWAIVPYPCIGTFRFLNLSISTHPAYPRVLSLLKEPATHRTLLDLGCCFAQDIRKFIYDGVPSENVYGSDLQEKFLDLGYDLFADRNSCKAHFFGADVFQEGGALGEVEEKIDLIYASSFFHIFSWDDQIKICKRMIKLLKPQKGSMIFGRQTGNLKGQEVVNAADSRGSHCSYRQGDTSRVWRHDVESFKKMWDVAGEETGTKWKVWAELDTGEGMDGKRQWAEKGLRRMRFDVERLD